MLKGKDALREKRSKSCRHITYCMSKMNVEKTETTHANEEETRV